jgi:hypothetical protein
LADSTAFSISSLVALGNLLITLKKVEKQVVENVSQIEKGLMFYSSLVAGSQKSLHSFAFDSTIFLLIDE